MRKNAPTQFCFSCVLFRKRYHPAWHVPARMCRSVAAVCVRAASAAVFSEEMEGCVDLGPARFDKNGGNARGPFLFFFFSGTGLYGNPGLTLIQVFSFSFSPGWIKMVEIHVDLFLFFPFWYRVVRKPRSDSKFKCFFCFFSLTPGVRSL